MSGRELAVLIVSYRRADLLDRALRSVEKHLPDSPVHVWDNASSGSDEVRALATSWPQVRWTFSESNLGYIAAMNRLAAQCPDADMLHLNPDAELIGPLTAARAALAQPRVAAVSPTVLDPEGREQPWDVAHREQSVLRNLLNAAGYAKRLRDHPRLAGLSDLYPEAPHDVDGYMAGCCLLLSRDAWEALGPFDERFFVYGEDATWQPAARRAGWTLKLVDDDGPQVRHAAAGTQTGDPLASQRGVDLLRAAQVMALGNAGNRGPGTVFSLGAAVLDRVQRSKRTDRRRRREAQTEQAAGRPGVVVTTNQLTLGGAERQRVLLANALVDRGHPVTLVCLQGLGLYTAELDPRVRLAFVPWWQPTVEVAGEDAVVVGGVTNTEVAFARAWRALGRVTGQRRRWMPATHDPARLDRPTYSGAVASVLRSADALLVLSAQHHVDLTRHQALTDVVMAAPNGIPAAAPRPFRATGTEPVRFAMLSRIVEYKNPLLLVDALLATGRDDWTLDVFGDGPDKARLEARTPQAARDRVRWHGQVSGPDAAFAETDVLCVPSDFEAFPLVMVEAMTRGVPVMASASGTVPEMLGHGAAGVVVSPATVETWAEALTAALTDRDRLAALGAAGRERALTHYTDAAMADAYQRAFARLLDRPIPGAPADPAELL
ncbi:glycosyltransferase [Actinomycetospora sp. CA-084318]|uniref:glycosyltransferase n=1 Tax=Actinomycetospora sp. CA-084318 TaxID=3239892 RepID=UPI003D982C38